MRRSDREITDRAVIEAFISEEQILRVAYSECFCTYKDGYMPHYR